MSEFGGFLFFILLMTIAFSTGAVLVGESSTYERGKESELLIEQCELSLPRDQFCELVAKPKGDVHE